MKKQTNPIYQALNSTEYKVREVDGTRYYDHRLKAGLKKKKGRKSKTVVDHVGGSKKDNRKGNLRVITRSANVAKSNRRRGKG